MWRERHRRAAGRSDAPAPPPRGPANSLASLLAYGWAKKHQDVVFKYVRLEHGRNRLENRIEEAMLH